MPRMGLTPETVVDAAVSLTEQHGFEAVTLARLADHLGIRSPSLYRHVDGLEGLRDSVMLRAIVEGDRRLKQATEGKTGREALQAMAHAYWQYARECPGLYAASIKAPVSGDPKVKRRVAAHLETALSVLAGFNLQGEDALHAARAFRAAVQGFTTLDAEGGFQMKLDLEESLTRLVDALAADFERRSS